MGDRVWGQGCGVVGARLATPRRGNFEMADNLHRRGVVDPVCLIIDDVVGVVVVPSGRSVLQILVGAIACCSLASCLALLWGGAWVVTLFERDPKLPFGRTCWHSWASTLRQGVQKVLVRADEKKKCEKLFTPDVTAPPCVSMPINIVP